MTAPIAIYIRARVGTLSLSCALDVSGVTALIGPNGAGKSTILKTLLGDRTPDRGEIRIGDATLFSSSQDIDLPIQARRLGYVPQRFALFPHLTVTDNIGFGLTGIDAEQRSQRVAELIRDFQLEPLAGRKPGTLSGGEAQRVAMARALAIRPRALLLDEPMSALDQTSKREVRALLSRLLADLEVPSLLVTHDIADVAALADQIAVLERGSIVQVGTLKQLRAQPASPFVAELVGSESGDIKA